MSFYKKSIPLILIVLLSYISLAQSIRLDRDALSGLASEEVVNVIFAYNELTFNSIYTPEQEYLDELHEKLSKREGKNVADTWEANYTHAKKKDIPKAFLLQLNEGLSEYKHAPTFKLNSPEAKYTMVVHTYWMYFGWDIGMIKQPAKVNLTIYFYNTDDPVNFISKSEVRKAEGLVSDSRYGNGLGPLPSLASMQHAYERTAPHLTKALKKIVK